MNLLQLFHLPKNLLIKCLLIPTVLQIFQYHTIFQQDQPAAIACHLWVMCDHNNRLSHMFINILQRLNHNLPRLRVKVSGRYCFVSTINILWLSTQLSSICGQNKSKAAHCPSCFSFTPKLSTLFFDIFNQLRIAADEISVKCLVHRLSVNFHHMCGFLFCKCCCTSDCFIVP